MRDRLIELLDKFLLDCIGNCPKRMEDTNKCFKCAYGKIADHLLANGVVVPPCKVGDTVYVIEPCHCYNNYSEFDKCHHRRTKATKWLEMVRVPTKHHTRCLKLFERPFKVEYMNKFGKKVFLTIEEAEAELKGGAE